MRSDFCARSAILCSQDLSSCRFIRPTGGVLPFPTSHRVSNASILSGAVRDVAFSKACQRGHYPSGMIHQFPDTAFATPRARAMTDPKTPDDHGRDPVVSSQLPRERLQLVVPGAGPFREPTTYQAPAVIHWIALVLSRVVVSHCRDVPFRNGCIHDNNTRSPSYRGNSFRQSRMWFSRKVINIKWRSWIRGKGREKKKICLQREKWIDRLVNFINSRETSAGRSCAADAFHVADHKLVGECSRFPDAIYVIKRH